MNRKIHISGDFRKSKFQNFTGGHAPDPLHGCDSIVLLYIALIIISYFYMTITRLFSFVLAGQDKIQSF